MNSFAVVFALWITENNEVTSANNVAFDDDRQDLLYIYTYIYIYTSYVYTIYTMYILYIYTTVYILYSLTRATLMRPGKNETRVCEYIYIYIYIYISKKVVGLVWSPEELLR